MSADGEVAEGPKAGWLARLAACIGGIGDALAKWALIAGGLFAAVEFLDAKEARTVERAMAYVTTYESGEVGEARRLVNGALRPYADQFADLNTAGGISSQDKDAVIATLIDADQDGKLADAIDRMVDFHNGIRLCVRSELCARDVVKVYFCTDRARRLWDDFRPYFAERRRNNPQYASGLEWCARGMGGAA